ncbi:MAG: tetratricopeptide repeat protein [Treponema sp.]|nr:tetratricopeptide repeat protein [Treponema sp.]
MNQNKVTDFRPSGTNSFRRKSQLLKRLGVTFLVVLALSLAGLFVRYIVKSHTAYSVSYLYKKWDEYDFQAVYERSAGILRRSPFNNAALTLHGYAAFFLALSENNTVQAQSYLDEAINNLRIALLDAKPKAFAQIEYMLGRAYFYKNTMSSYYYYADLSVQYLQRAVRDGYRSDDIPECLGLSYAALGMTLESIQAFTEALLVRESDTLLLSIAEQYYKAGHFAAAAQYLFRISVDCKDERIVQKSHLLLGNIYISQERYDEAEKEFQTILEKNENIADAYYGIGVIYEKQGDVIKARAEWRKALRVQANHADALKKIAEYK